VAGARTSSRQVRTLVSAQSQRPRACTLNRERLRLDQSLKQSLHTLDVQPSSVGWQVRTHQVLALMCRSECARVHAERLRSRPDLSPHRSFWWRIHKPYPTDTAVRVPRAPDCGHTSLCASPHKRATPGHSHPCIRDRRNTPDPQLRSRLVPPTPHIPHALACSPPPGVLSLASCVRIRRAANAKPHSYTQSTHVADQQQTESLLPAPRHVT
jgi:hypothetical protein